MNVLFVGNGINRFANIVPGWSELFSKAVNIDGFKMQKSLTPTMEYDLNTHLILDRDPTKKSTDIKRSIAAYLKGIQNGLPKNWADTIHKRLMDVAPSIVLTTNYDYFLEYAADDNFSLEKASTREILYSKERFRTSGAHQIFHIHGEISSPSSICLGYAHYIGSIQYIRSELTKTYKSGKSFHLYAVLNGEEPPVPNRWYYHFFMDDIYILGFGMDAAELDIWWLLNYRAELMHRYPGLIKNKIVYLETDSSNDYAPKHVWESVEKDAKTREKYMEEKICYERNKEILEEKKILLETFHVEVVDCTNQSDSENGVDSHSIYGKRYERAMLRLRDGCALALP